MAIADIVTYGFGSYSTVGKIPTLGFGIADLPTGKASLAFSTKAPGFSISTKAPSIGSTTKAPTIGFEVS